MIVHLTNDVAVDADAVRYIERDVASEASGRVPTSIICVYVNNQTTKMYTLPLSVGSIVSVINAALNSN